MEYKSWREIYESKLTDAKTVASTINDGDKIVVACGPGEPYYIEKAIADNYENYRDVEITSMMYIGVSPWIDEKMKGHIRHNCMFASPSTRKAIAMGLCDFTTSHFYEIPTVIRDYIKPRIAITMVSPPDEHGYVSFGTNVDYIKGAIDFAEIKIAQVNKNMPRTFGNSIKHVREFTYFVEVDTELPGVPSVEITDVEREIGKNCASLIKDGDCLQLGIGGIPDAVCECLYDKKHLGIHSEMLGDSVVGLIEAGVVDNSMKQSHPGRTVISFAFGTEKFNKFIDNNPAVEFHPIDFVNNPTVIARNDNVVSINSCIQVDLLGQVVSDTVGLNQFSAVGGQVDFVRGATMSKGGRSIIAMPSTAKNGHISRIVPLIHEGSAITTPRNDVNYVVTEYGIAQLKGKNTRERAKELIKIAHPKFRSLLILEYKRRFNEDPGIEADRMAVAIAKEKISEHRETRDERREAREERREEIKEVIEGRREAREERREERKESRRDKE